MTLIETFPRKPPSPRFPARFTFFSVKCFPAFSTVTLFPLVTCLLHVLPLDTRYMVSLAYHSLKASRDFHPFKVFPRLSQVTYFPALATRSLHLILHLSPVKRFFLSLPPVKALTKQEKELTKVCHALLFSRAFHLFRCLRRVLKTGPNKKELTKVSNCFMFSRDCHSLHLSLHLPPVTFFPRACNPVHMFSRACHPLHVFPRLILVTRFPALATRYMFSRA